MPTAIERRDIQKAMAFDLLQMLRADPDKMYSVDELEKLITAYITGGQQ